MKSTLICCTICICITLVGCASTKNTPLSSHGPGAKLNADTIGLFDAFTKHEDLKALFVQAASGCMPLAPAMESSTSYRYYDDGKDGYYTYKEGQMDESLCVDNKTADAIHKISERLPGVHVRMFEMEKGKMCVAFTIVKNTTGKDDAYYEEDLIYSSQDLASLNEKSKIEEGWWFWSGLMP